MESAAEYYKSLGSEFSETFADMLVLDAIICNTDRHLGNFGLLVDNRSNKIDAPAPLFDHGNSLFSLAGLDSFDSEKDLTEYADTLLPCLYDDFMGSAKAVLTQRHHDGLRKLVDFKFEKHSRYNLPSKRLKLIEKQIQIGRASCRERV